MEELGSPQFGGIGNIIRKKRSQTSRRPRPESLQFSESHDHSPLTLTPALDDVSKVSSDENTGGDTNSRRKEFNLNRCVLKGSASKAGGYPHKRIKKDGSSGLSYGNGGLEDSIDQGGSGLNQRQCSEEISTPAKWKSTSKTKGSLELRSTTSDIHDGRNGEIPGSEHPRMNGNELGNNKLKKVKLKVGGVTSTIQTKSNSQGASGGGYSTKNSRTSDAPRSRPKLILQDNSDDDNSPPYKNSGMLGIPWKDFSRDSSTWAKEDSSMGKMPSKNASGNQVEKSEPVRKSKRVPKRRVLDGAFDEDDEDDEIRYLEKLRTFKIAAGREDFEEESIKKQQRISRVSKNGKCDEILEDFASMSSKDGKKKSRSERGSEDTDYDEEEELVSDGEPGGNKKKKLRNDSIDSSIESKREPALTTRQRALLNKDASSASGASVIEFPSGLPPVPPRKQKEKLSETEQQLKKAEAAQRRRVQVEKAARESEAEAIRKILGQDSSRKKREDKIKKRQEELAQERAANALMLPSSTIRYVTGPTGTIVTFSKDMGLPSIFYSKPCIILPRVKNVLAHLVPTHTSTEIRSPNFLFAVSIVTRWFMNSCSLKLPANVAIILTIPWCR
ncbi:unnamed protein product [Camellia sinensis]